eukprot:13078438-Alexandrium_andersonii.AAC.1
MASEVGESGGGTHGAAGGACSTRSATRGSRGWSADAERDPRRAGDRPRARGIERERGRSARSFCVEEELGPERPCWRS